MIFISADMSQAEARIVALLAQDEYLLHIFNTDQDIHSITYSWIHEAFYGKSPTKEEITEDRRFLGKTGRHAMAYGEGKHKLMLSTNSDARKFGIDVSISEKQAGQILQTLHGRSPKIRAVYHRDVIQALECNNNRRLINPYGRARTFYGRWGDDLFREAYAQIPQSTVPDHLKHAGLRLHDKHTRLQFLKEDHDGFLFQVPIREAERWAKIIKDEIEVPIDFSRCSLPRGILTIPCEIKTGYNYKDMVKI